ncbi:conserved exported hypothetical protein [uncultured Eubacteriales bacterium]|uniref:Phage-shock protein n=1 Tax=uncultured Eubacteriales bacterium TaxID=172733 RepID=A0A212IVD4_9FIRM|nr:conserved exported hypothetical protein [uncultured Eubacteriales bacterium]
MLTLSILCLVGVIVIPVVLAVLSIPFAIIIGLLPWLLRIAGVVLAIKALMDKPVRWENFTPALGAFLLSAVIKWIF